MMKVIKNHFKVLAVLFVSLVAFQSNAVRYEFVAADNTFETKLCILAAKDKLNKFKTSVRTTRLGVRMVANVVACNDMAMANFAKVFGAEKTANYLMKKTKPSILEQDGSVTIKDIASSSLKNNDVVYIHVSSN